MEEVQEGATATEIVWLILFGVCCFVLVCWCGVNIVVSVATPPSRVMDIEYAPPRPTRELREEVAYSNLSGNRSSRRPPPPYSRLARPDAETRPARRVRSYSG